MYRDHGGDLMINGNTKVIGIIGWPVGHSLSPALHNAAFAALSLDYVYVPLPVAPDRVAAAISGLPALGFRGANVTVPHKSAVLPFIDEVDENARLAGAVNTIVVDDSRLSGHNTDVVGFGQALREVVTEPLGDLPVLVLGAGGVGRAAVVWLARAGADLTIVDLTVEIAEQVAAVARAAAPNVRVRALPVDSLGAADVAAATLLVNATSLGMDGAGKVPRVFVDNVRNDHVVYDVVYAREPTELIAQARERGARVIEGPSMLLWQAAAAFELWTGVAAPLDVMRSVVKR